MPIETRHCHRLLQIMSIPLIEFSSKITQITGNRNCRWGNNRYLYAQNFYDLLTYLTETCKMEETYMFVFLGIKVDFGVNMENHIIDESKIVSNLKLSLLTKWQNDVYKWTKAEYDRKRYSLLEVRTIAQIFLKLTGWDLYKITKWIVKATFPRMKIETTDATLFSRELDDSFKIGFYCWLLKRHGLIKNEKSFYGFN